MDEMSERCHNKGLMGHEGGALKAEFQGKMYCTVCSPPYCPKCHYVMKYLKGCGTAKAGFECMNCLRKFNDMQAEIRHD